MIIRSITVATACLFAGLSTLPYWRAPTLTGWKLTIVAGEFGHFLAILSLGAAAASAWRLVRWGAAGWVALALLFIAGVLFARPVMQARSLSRTLPQRMAEDFGELGNRRPYFQFSGLWRWRDPEVPVETMTYTRAGTPHELALDFYRAIPKDVAGTGAPCVIALHGGGWDGGTRDQIPTLYSLLATEGFAVAAISYRLAPQHPWPAQLDDVRDAIAFLSEHAPQLGIDETQLLLFGRSAGGQIASAAGYGLNNPAIRGVAAFYAPHDLNFAWDYGREDDVLNSIQLLRQYMGGAPEDVGTNFNSASAILRVERGKTPPTFLIHGTNDTLVWRRQSERLAARLREENVPHVFIELPWATHGFEINLHGPSGQIATRALEQFLHAVTATSRKPEGR